MSEKCGLELRLGFANLFRAPSAWSQSISFRRPRVNRKALAAGDGRENVPHNHRRLRALPLSFVALLGAFHKPPAMQVVADWIKRICVRHHLSLPRWSAAHNQLACRMDELAEENASTRFARR